jgi:hypothetical protein
VVMVVVVVAYHSNLGQKGKLWRVRSRFWFRNKNLRLLR